MATDDDRKVIFSMVGVSKVLGQREVIRDISPGFFYGVEVGVLQMARRTAIRRCSRQITGR